MAKVKKQGFQKVQKFLDKWLELGLTIIAGAVLIGVAAYVMHIGFSYYWYMMHSDVVGDLSFVREARYQRSLFPYGWPHLQEMRFVHITTIILPFYIITNNIHLSYPLAVSFMIVVNMLLFYFMLSYRKRKLLPIFVGFTVVLIVFSRYAMFSVFSVLFVNGSLALSMSTIFVTIGVYMRIKSGEKYGRVATIAMWVLVPLLAFLQGIQSNRMLIALYLPLLIIECYPLVVRILQDKGFDYKKTDKSILFVILCAVCNLLGIALIISLIRREVVLVEYTLVTTSLHMVNHRGLWDQFERFVVEILLAFGLQSGVEVYSMAGVAYFGRIALVAIMAIIVRKTTAKESEDGIIRSILFTSLCALSIAMVVTFTGVGERFIFTIIMMLGVMAVICFDYFVENKRKMLTVMAYIVVFVMVVISVRTLDMPRDESLRADRQRIADFIVENNFVVGYGPFWQGPVVAAFADLEFDVIYLSAGTFRTRPHAIPMERYNHDEDRVFLILTSWQVGNVMNNDHQRAILESGTRHDFPGGWIVFTFEHNPFR